MAVLPIYNTIVVPGANIYLKTGVYQKMTGRTPRTDEKVTLIVAKEELQRQEMHNDSFYPIGIAGNIIEINSNGYLVIHLRSRVDINEITVFQDGSIDIVVARRKDIEDLDAALASERLRKLKEEIARISEDFQWSSAMRGIADSWNSVGEIAAAFSPWVSLSNEERYALLAEDSEQKRFDMMEKMIYENLEMIKVRFRAKSAQEEDYQKIYKESAIKKQMEFLQKELDEMHPENVSDLRKLEIRLEESEMNETARNEGRRILNRLKSEGSNSAEAGMLHDYLDLLTSLPWKKEEARSIALEEAEKILEADHFGLEKVKRRIIEQIAVMQLKQRQSGSILLFVGAPGTGKTSIGQSIAKALGREYVRVSLGGVRDEADIRGHRRTYIGSMPGRIIDGIKKAGVSNPVMVLDEVDKLSQSYNGDPASALLEVLDPEQNHTFTDHYLNVPFDLSDVFFICTANSVDTIPEPLLNRMEMIRFQGYTPLEKLEIGRRHLLPKSMEAAGISSTDFLLEEEALKKVISDYTREAGVRGLKKRLDQICRTAAVQMVRSKNDGLEENRDEEKLPANVPAKGEPDNIKIRVTADNLKDFVDGHPVHQKNVPAKARPGVVTGLAWTSVGGDILYIETILTDGEGKVRTTGQLGDVMKESAQIALSLMKDMFPEAAGRLKEQDLHIHVPDGATPKDGPSAGITLTTALSSLILGVPVPPDVAMTGEVSLQGRVNPIGGLPEKLMAAQRAGVKRVFIPRENEEDLDDVAPEVLREIEVIPVETVEEVLERLGIGRDVKQAD